MHGGVSNSNMAPTTLPGQQHGAHDAVPGGADRQAGVATDVRPWRYTPVQCARCGVGVRVVKFSLQHTSVQWPDDAVLGCAEFAAAGGASALIPSCASLRHSIEDAVAGGRVEVLPP